MTKALQQAMTMDIDNLPGQFLNTTYKSKGIASKDDTERTYHWKAQGKHRQKNFP